MSEGQIRTPDQRLRVFISSTLGELADERVAARASVGQLRLTPVMFEIGARAHPPRALYRSYLDQSDVFVGIYWQRYGWIAPDMEVSGLEDEWLLSDGMPRLLYVKRPAPEIEPRLAEMLDRVQAEDIASYKPFSSVDELHDLLLDDLAVLLTERFDGAREAPVPRPSSDPARAALPAQTSSFVGREAEVDDVRALLADDQVRFLTLSGPAGTGKTRLAIQAVGEEAGRYPDGVHFVDLSGEREVDGALEAVARAVCTGLASEVRPIDALEAELRDRRALLLLDNLEQVAPLAVELAGLLSHAAALTLVVTSREALRVRAEHIYQVPPLGLPEGDGLEAAEASGAVQLFCDRAAVVRSGFRLDHDNVRTVIEICRHLDGLPLAIELAAARVKLFDLDELLDRLTDRLDVLRGGARDLPERQQTLRDAIEWSYDLLSDDERLVLGFFTVFADARLVDFEDTALAVDALTDVEVIEVLGSLVDKSLVRSVQGVDGRPRFSLLQTIRAFALEAGDLQPDVVAAARRAHAQHYVELAVRIHEDQGVDGREVALAKLAAELGNLGRAWREWTALGDVPRLNELLAPLWGYCDARGDYRSAVELGYDLLACLAVSPDSPDRRRAEFVVHMNVARTELAVRGFTAEAERLTREALARAGAADDVAQRFPGLRSLAYLHVMRSDFDAMGVIAREMMEIAEQERDPSLLAEAHLLVGHSRLWSADFQQALDHYARAVEFVDAVRAGHVDFQVGPHPAVVATVVSALTQWLAGFPETATVTMERAAEVAGELDHPYSVAYALQHASLLHLWQGELDDVRRRADELQDLAEARDYPTWQALAMVFGGFAMVGTGEVEVGLARVEEGVERYKDLSAPPLFWAALLMIRARALAVAGRGDEALTLIGRAEAAVQHGDPQALHIGIAKGDLLLGASPPDPIGAATAFRRVVASTEGTDAHMARLLALTRLLELGRGTPDEAAAAHALRAELDTFTEGFDTPSLVAARAALDPS